MSEGLTDPAKFPDFWTWLPQSITYGGHGISTTGWFMFMSVVYAEDDVRKTSPQMQVSYLTPANKPIKFLIPQSFLGDKNIANISAADVVEMMKKLFSAPFREIPPAPTTIPIERLPPHKREQLRRAIRQRRGL